MGCLLLSGDVPQDRTRASVCAQGLMEWDTVPQPTQADEVAPTWRDLPNLCGGKKSHQSFPK